MGCFALTGYARPFYELTQEQREGALKSWSTSPLSVKRKAFAALKTLTCSLYFVVLS